jgi:hypothetical protein
MTDKENESVPILDLKKIERTRITELNPDLVRAIEGLMPGCDRGLVEAMLRIHFARLASSDRRGPGHWELHQSPEGRICGRPRWIRTEVE